MTRFDVPVSARLASIIRCSGSHGVTVPNTLLPYDQPYLDDDAEKSSLFGCLTTLLEMSILLCSSASCDCVHETLRVAICGDQPRSHTYIS